MPCRRVLATASTALRAGDCANSIPDVIADLQREGVTVSPASLNIAGCALSGSTVTCNGTGFPTNNNPNINIPNGFSNDVKVYNAIGKVDSTSTKIAASAGCTSSGTTRGRSKTFRSCNRSGGRRFTRAPRWLAEVGRGLPVPVGSMKPRWIQPPLPTDTAWRSEYTTASSYGLDTGVSGPFTGGLPRIGFGGYFFPGLGGFKWPKFQGPDSITQFIDHVSVHAGNHSLKFGGELHRDSM
jgi:hypothetical protein